ncbi:unnamed protein product [Paramecium sonneborni]|uniref:WD40-repeat-containing domain n=1 Tax=Paramecium sonneborni TaxID=65129 RepID=A0A8S1MGX9_9CILI|nr:unnamed protein product [Paramecium sonneborni]
MSFIIPNLFCEAHKKTQITLLNLTVGNKRDQRLFCYRCNIRAQSNLYCLEDINELTTSLKKSENENIKKIQEDTKKLNKIKIYIDQIQEMYNKLESDHQQLLNSVIDNQIIKPNDDIDVFLQKKSYCTKQELIMMTEKVSNIIKQNSDKLELLENYSIKYLDQHQQQEENINYLYVQLQWAEQKQVGQKQEIVSEIQQQNFEQIIPEIEQMQDQGVQQFQEKVEIQLEQTRIYDIKFNTENNIFVVGSSKLSNSNCYAQVWRFEKGQASWIQDLENSHQNDIKSICFLNSDDSFFTGSQDSSIIFWKKEHQKWEIGQELAGQQNSVIGLQLNSAGNILAAISSQIHLWTKLNQQWEKGQVLNDCKKQFLCLSFNNDDSYIVAGSSDCQIYIYQYQNGKWILKNKITDQSQEVTFVTFLDEQNIMGLLKDNHLNYYEWSQNNTYEQKLIAKISSYQIGYSKKKRTLIVSSGKTNETQIYQQEQQGEIKSIQQIQVKSEQVYQSNDGCLIAILTNQKLKFYQQQKNEY